MAAMANDTVGHRVCGTDIDLQGMGLYGVGQYRSMNSDIHSAQVAHALTRVGRTPSPRPTMTPWALSTSVWRMVG